MIAERIAAEPVTIAEWTTREVVYGDPTAADERLASDLRAGQGLVELDWLRDGRLRVTSKAWVGVICLSNLEIRVVPKLVGEELGVLGMIEYCSGLPALRRVDAVRTLKSGGSNLVDLICQMLNDEADGLIREGLLQDYVPREETLTAVRGKLRLRDQFLRRYGQVDLLECAFDEFEGDILENRIVGAGLLAARRLTSNWEIRERAARLESVFAEVASYGALDPELADSMLVYHRRNEHYRSAHEWAFMLLEHSRIRELFDAGDRRVSAFLINMNTLFERFVTRLLTDAYVGSDVRVSSQRRTPSVIVDEASGRTYAQIIPDIMLTSNSPERRSRLPIDAKYKLYDQGGIAQSDIYQTFMYAIAFGDPNGPTPATVIIYPGDTTGRATDLAILREGKTRSARIHCLSLNVPEMLAGVRNQNRRSTESGPVATFRSLADECMRRVWP